MRVIVEIVTGEAKGRKTWLADGQRIEIGRTEMNDFPVPTDGYMSGRHFAIEVAEAKCFLRDLKSSNGTYLNGDRADDVVLKDGDMVVAGQTRFAIQIQASARQTLMPSGEQPPIQPLSVDAEFESTLVGLPPGQQEPPQPPVAPPPVDPPQASPSDVAPPNPPPAAPASPPVQHFAPPPPSAAPPSPRSTLAGPPVSGYQFQPSEPVQPMPVNESPDDQSVRSTLQMGSGPTDERVEIPRDDLIEAVRSREPWLMDHCRRQSSIPSISNWDAIYLLTVLGKPSDLEQVQTLGAAKELGLLRYMILSTFGHPAVIQHLLIGIENQDPAVALAAAKGYTKVTGQIVDSEQPVIRTELALENRHPMEHEMLDNPLLPSPERARRHWGSVASQQSQGKRWCRGFEMSQQLSDEVLQKLDTQSRWEACLRGLYDGTWEGNLADVGFVWH